MFTKPKKVFPPGTFLPTPQRVLAILQLCLAFIAICIYAGHPFLGALFNHKAKLAPFESIMGIRPEPLGDEDRQQQQFNKTAFTSLPEGEKLEIMAHYQYLLKSDFQSFAEKFKEACLLLFFKIPAFTRAWIFFSILLSILMLKKREGATQAAWVLPILTIAFVFDTYKKVDRESPIPEDQLFPTEHVIVRDYLKEPLSSSILTQHQQLKKGWQIYLIKEWANETPSLNSAIYNQQVIKGNFAFNLALLKIRMNFPENSTSTLARTFYNPLFLSFFYFCWNLFFAWFMNRNRWKYNYI